LTSTFAEPRSLFFAAAFMKNLPREPPDAPRRLDAQGQRWKGRNDPEV